MNKKLFSLSVFAIALALVFSLGNFGIANAQQERGDTFFSNMHPQNVDRDLGSFHKNDVNQFGDDRAYSSASGTDRDADFRAYNFVPNTYGLQGDYWYDSQH